MNYTYLGFAIIGSICFGLTCGLITYAGLNIIIGDTNIWCPILVFCLVSIISFTICWIKGEPKNIYLPI